MKVFISADIEGVTGVTHWDETDMSKPESAVAREQMTAEVVAACEGALQAGASEIWVKDAHWTGRNIIASKLPQEVKLVRGWSSHPALMMQEIDDSFHAVVLVGYHSGAGRGTNPLAHSFNPECYKMTLNGNEASELLINAYTASYYHVPVVFVSGDKGICDEAATLNGNIATMAVKEGIGDSTISIHPAAATRGIGEKVRAALGGDVSTCLVALASHFVVTITYRSPSKAYRNGFYPGAKRTSSDTIRFEATDYFEVLRFLLFAT